MPLVNSSPRLVISLLAALGLIFRPTLASCQSSWESYRPHSLASIISQERETVLGAFAAEPEHRIALDGSSFPSLPTIQYMDSTRAISFERLDLIRRWITSYGIRPQALGMYQSEMLFREGSLEVWLPVQNTLIQDLRTQLNRGDPVTLFIVWVGARGTPEDIDWVFVVYGFRKGVLSIGCLHMGVRAGAVQYIGDR